MIPWIFLGCTQAPVVEDAPLTLQVSASDLTPAGGVLTVRGVVVGDAVVDLPEPTVEGLTFERVEGPDIERLGGRTLVTSTYRFAGKKGSYEVGALTLRSGELEASSLPVWVDLGVEAPHLQQLADIEEPAPLWAVPWTPILCGVGSVAALGGMVVLAFVSVVRRPAKPEVPLPPDIRCLRAWESVRDNPAFDDEERALELSRLFRAYTEEVLGFPAVSWTTTEILEHLSGMQHLPSGNVPRAKKLLRATDLVKYAEVAPGTDFFDDMDADLRAFVSSTRPTAWQPEGQDG